VKRDPGRRPISGTRLVAQAAIGLGCGMTSVSVESDTQVVVGNVTHTRAVTEGGCRGIGWVGIARPEVSCVAD
jgi:hypothetical protein